MARKLGMNCKLYRGAALLDGDTVTPATASWTELDDVRDLTLNLQKGEADMTTRANDGWRAIWPTLKDGTIEFEALWDPDDAGFAALLSAWKNDTEIALACMDQAITTEGAEGLASNFHVLDCSRSEPLEDGVKASVVIKPSSYSEWYEVSGS